MKKYPVGTYVPGVMKPITKEDHCKDICGDCGTKYSAVGKTTGSVGWWKSTCDICHNDDYCCDIGDWRLFSWRRDMDNWPAEDLNTHQEWMIEYNSRPEVQKQAKEDFWTNYWAYDMKKKEQSLDDEVPHLTRGPFKNKTEATKSALNEGWSLSPKDASNKQECKHEGNWTITPMARTFCQDCGEETRSSR